VVEADVKSGALVTANEGLEQGRPVLAVPGPITSRTSAGCNKLIQQGAKPALCAADILEELGLAAGMRELGLALSTPAARASDRPHGIAADAVESDDGGAAACGCAGRRDRERSGECARGVD